MLNLGLVTITWYGQSCFKIESRETTLAFDPFSKEIGLTPPRFRADVVLVTHGHPDHANVETFPGEPFAISGPGEYETRGIAVSGIATFHDAAEGKDRGLNTIFRIETEGMVLAHMGDFGEAKIREETLDALGDVDILFVPVGGTYTIDGETAADIVNQVEPRIVIPMHYALPGLKVKLAPVNDFLKAHGAKGEELDKLVIKKKDLPESSTRTIVLTVA